MAGLGAMLGLFEVPVSIFTERYGLSRKVASLLTLLILVIIGMPAALSQSITADFKVFGLNPFEFFDFISSNILLPLGGIMTCIFVGCVYGLPALRKQLSNNGTLSNTRLIHALFFVIRYISPFLITIVLLHGLKLI
jgi:NSS family neurotransmitter:Na+ symporter